jgi:hypothetical protein
LIYHLDCNKSNTTGVISVAGTVFPPGAPDFTPVPLDNPFFNSPSGFFMVYATIARRQLQMNANIHLYSQMKPVFRNWTLHTFSAAKYNFAKRCVS